jgi:hypothetical protein
LLIVGPPGAGEYVLAARLPSIRPPYCRRCDARDAACAASIRGCWRTEVYRAGATAFRAIGGRLGGRTSGVRDDRAPLLDRGEALPVSSLCGDLLDLAHASARRYTGTGPVWPRLYARVYHSTGTVSERGWSWVLAETVTIGTDMGRPWRLLSMPPSAPTRPAGNPSLPTNPIFLLFSQTFFIPTYIFTIR